MLILLSVCLLDMFIERKAFGNLGGVFSKTRKPRKTGAISGPVIFGG